MSSEKYEQYLRRLHKECVDIALDPDDPKPGMWVGCLPLSSCAETLRDMEERGLARVEAHERPHPVNKGTMRTLRYIVPITSTEESR